MNPFFIKELLMELERKRWEERMAASKPSPQTIRGEDEIPAWLKDYLTKVYGSQMRDRPHTMEVAPHHPSKDKNMKTAIPRFSSPRSHYPMLNLAYPRERKEDYQTEPF